MTDEKYKKIIEDRKRQMIEVVEQDLPRLTEKCEVDMADVIIFHQDAYAGDYQMHEYLILGMAIKYIGLTGKEIHIIGKNRETIDKLV